MKFIIADKFIFISPCSKFPRLRSTASPKNKSANAASELKCAGYGSADQHANGPALFLGQWLRWMASRTNSGAQRHRRTYAARNFRNSPLSSESKSVFLCAAREFTN